MPESYECGIRPDSKILICSSSGGGKTFLVIDMLINYRKVFIEAPTKIYVFYLHYQPAYDRLRQSVDIECVFLEGAPADTFKPQKGAFVLLDDLMGVDSEQVREFYTRKAHHFHVCCAYLVQNLFSKNKHHRDISLNVDYIVVFRNRRDISQIKRLGQGLFGTGGGAHLERGYNDLTYNKPHSYVFIDVHQETPEEYKIRSSVIPESGVTRAYQEI